MKQSILKGCPLAVTVAALFLGLLSCQKQETLPVEQAPEVVTRAGFTMAVDGSASATKASIEGACLTWKTGDKIVMASNGKINGTLVCTSVDGSNNATFSGMITNFTPAGVNLFFLGNREADGMNPVFDFSNQSGSIYRAASYLFLKSTGVALARQEGDVYTPTEAVVFEGMTSLLTLTLDPAGSPGAVTGTLATSVAINGLKNALSVNLSDGAVTPTFVKSLDGSTDVTVTNVAPTSVMDYTNNYVVAVVPQNAENLTMSVSYLNADGSTAATQWSGINWDMSNKAGMSIVTDWADSKAPAIVLSSQKYGYSGEAVEGGENTDGRNHKGGYNGANADGTSDNPTGGKPGYGGAEVI